MGSLYYSLKDETQALHYYLESHRYTPTDVSVITFWGVWYVNHNNYEKAVGFFELASQI
jgi:intraflagellar transport protein 88